MRRFAVRFGLAALLLSLPLSPAAVAQTSDDELRQEIEALKKGQQEIQKELQEIKKLIQARPAAPPPPSGPNVKGKVFNLGANPVKGERSAKLTLVEFTDYQ